MKHTAPLCLVLLGFGSSLAWAAPAASGCPSQLPLAGTMTIERCAEGESCVSAVQALYEYAAKGSGKDDPAALNIFLHASPWRFYDPEMRILTVEDLAKTVQPYRKKGVRRVVLKASWSGVAPGPAEKSLASRLSEALGGMPVEGQDGFLWLTADGSLRTTRQAVSLMAGSGAYRIKAGNDVMAALAAGWPATVEDSLRQARDASGLLRAAAGSDIFFLCPERARELFEEAAALGNAIAAYTAALMRLERGASGDRDTALAYLAQAAWAGDRPARERLRRLAP